MADSPKFLSPLPISRPRKKQKSTIKSPVKRILSQNFEQQLKFRPDENFKDIIMPLGGRNPHFKNQSKRLLPKKNIKRVKIAPALDFRKPGGRSVRMRGPNKHRYFNGLPHVIKFPIFRSFYNQIQGKKVPFKETDKIDFPKVFEQIKKLSIKKQTSARENQLLMKYALKLMRLRHRKNAGSFQEMYERVHMGEQQEEEMITVIKKEEKKQEYSEIDSIEVMLEQAESETWKTEEDSELVKWRNQGMKEEIISQLSLSEQVWGVNPLMGLLEQNAGPGNLEENEVYTLQNRPDDGYQPTIGMMEEDPWYQQAKDSQESDGVRSSQNGLPSDKRSGSQTSSQSVKSNIDTNKALEDLEKVISSYVGDLPILPQEKLKRNAKLGNQKVARSRVRLSKMKKYRLKRWIKEEWSESRKNEDILRQFDEIEFAPPDFKRKQFKILEREKLRYNKASKDLWMDPDEKYISKPGFEEYPEPEGYIRQDMDYLDQNAVPLNVEKGVSVGEELEGDEVNMYEKLQRDLPLRPGDKVEECGYLEKIKVTQKAAQQRAQIILEISAQLIDERESVPVTLKQALYSLNVRNGTLQIEAFFNLQRNGHCTLFQEDDGPEAPIYIIPSRQIRRQVAERARN